jgi:hypothetical protein
MKIKQVEIMARAAYTISMKSDKEWQQFVDGAIERAVGFYYEKTKHDIGLVLEATDFIRQELARKPDREEFDELKADVTTLKHALKATNQDLHQLAERVAGIETKLQYA